MKPNVSRGKSINYALLALLSGIFFVLCLITAEFILIRRNKPEQISSRLEQVLHRKELQAKNILNINSYDFLQTSKQKGQNNFPESLPDIRKNGIALQYYLHDSLVFWSDNSVDELKSNQLEKEDNIQKLPNGWYQVLVFKKGNIKTVCLILIKYEYSFENEYLENTFQKDFDIPENIGISHELVKNPVCSVNGTPLFSLDFTGYTPSYDHYVFLLFFLFLSAFFSLSFAIYFLYSAIEWLRKKPWLFVICFIADVALLRLLQMYFTFPASLYSTVWFSPLYYSSSVFLPSAGDYLINSLIMLMVAYVAFVKLYREKPIPGRQLASGIFNGWKAVLFILAIYMLLCYGLNDLIRNSSFFLDLKDISKIGLQSLIGLLIAYLLSMAFYLFSRTAGSYTVNADSKTKVIFISITAICVFLVSIFWWNTINAIILAILFAAFLSLIFFYYNENIKSSPFANIILPMIWMAVLVAAVFNYAGYSKEREERKLIAMKLATEKNPVTELFYNKLERKLLSDSLILVMSKDTDAVREGALVKRIKTEYIRNYWNRFTVQITVCPPGKMLRIQPRGYVFDCQQYFRQVCEKVGEKTANPNLFYLDYETGIETYLAVLNPHDSVVNSKDQGILIYIEFTAKTPAKDLGYPELLIDRRIMNIPDLGNYSYALYQSGSLVYKTGKYAYTMGLNDLIPSSDSAPFFNSAGMDHFRFNMNKSRVLVISKKDDSFLGVISPASYLFILFSFLSLFLNLIFRPSILREFSFMTLKSRFQLANVGIIVVSFLILGCLLLYFLIRLNNLKNMDSFTERTLSVISDMQNDFGDKENFNKPDKTFLEEDLQKLSGMFYTDVNVYSPNGKLILSSRPQVFDEGLISGRMNIGALADLRSNRQSVFFQDEKIGAYDYISAYFPLLNDKNELLAYINLPFFSRQEDLKKEINDFLVAFMNLYILFILISVFISIAISRYLSAPLRILVSRMEGFQLGERNEKISWNHHDEIGRLVEEYNRLIDELAFSADQLAKSERESAWREMAKQVAHEIKNPLTPMKLSVQHLRKAWDDKSDDFNLRIQRFTKIMTDQIDSLSAIASEFSDFAKMPLPVAEDIDLVEILNSILSMYSGLDKIQISLKTSEKNASIIGDKKQLVRVFTNLFNNAIQAISNTERGLIKVVVRKQESSYAIDIEDNGNGIPDELAEKIFLPNFTTKSGGAGLGLAIVREIIRSMGGEVNFASGKNGTVFTVTIPIHYEKISG